MNVTIKDIIIGIRKRVAESPDNVYHQPMPDTCYYGQGVCADGTIGCIFGQAFKRLNFVAKRRRRR